MVDAAALEVTCREFVELATDFMEDGLTAHDRAMVEEHLVFCDWCVTYLQQLEAAREVMSSLAEEPVTDGARESLMAAFRTWREERRST